MECCGSFDTMIVKSAVEIKNNVVVEQYLVYGRLIDIFNGYLLYSSYVLSTG